MGIFAEITGTEDVFKKLDAMPGELTAAIKQLYGVAASRTYDGSQGDAPVLSGDLKGSGYVEPHDEGNAFYIDVGYGDGLPPTGKDYSYPEGMSTSTYSDGDMTAQTYPWFVELGHLSRAGNLVPPQPFLGPNFDRNVNDLIDELKSLGFVEV